MREAFSGWYPPTEEERRAVYRDGLVVLDSNVLLSLYRFRATAREEVIGLLRQVAERLWLPHQAGMEFHKNRLNVIYNTSQEFEDLKRNLSNAQNKIRNAFEGAQARTRVEEAPLSEALQKVSVLVEEQLAQFAPQLKLSDAIQGDPILEAVTSLYSGRVGKPFDEKRFKQESEAGLARLKDETPPGYLDQDKDEPFGDYFIWRQTLDIAKERRQAVLLVTQDKKPDWFRQVHGMTVGPRPELLDEMFNEAGMRLHLVTLDTFLEQGASYLDTAVSADTVEEAQRLPAPIEGGQQEQEELRAQVVQALEAKGWLVRRYPRRMGRDGNPYNIDISVPFSTDANQDAPIDSIAFIVSPNRPVGERSYYGHLFHFISIHTGPLVLVTPNPERRGASLPSTDETYRCGWGEFPKFQAVTLQDIEENSLQLPVQGILRS